MHVRHSRMQQVRGNEAEGRRRLKATQAWTLTTMLQKAPQQAHEKLRVVSRVMTVYSCKCWLSRLLEGSGSRIITQTDRQTLDLLCMLAETYLRVGISVSCRHVGM